MAKIRIYDNDDSIRIEIAGKKEYIPKLGLRRFVEGNIMYLIPITSENGETKVKSIIPIDYTLVEVPVVTSMFELIAAIDAMVETTDLDSIITELQAIKTSVQIMDDWDRNDSAKVQGSIEHDSPDTQYPVMIGGRAATAKPTAVANNDVVRAYFDQYGRLHIYDEGGGGVGGGGFMTYILDSTNSLGHGKVEYTAATQITASVYSFTINPRLIIKIERFNSGGTYQETITPTSHLITVASGVFTITGMSASAGDLFVLYIQGQERTVDAFQDAQKTKNQNPDWAHRENQTENITPTVAVQYFAISMDTYKHASIGICVSGTVTSTLKCYAINDASVTIPTSGAIPAGWTDVSTDILGAASVAIANVSPATTCSKFFIDTAISVEYLLLQFDTSAASSTPLIVPRVLKFY